MSTQNRIREFYSPSDIEKREWLEQHVPHRICAALTWLPMPEEWAVRRPKQPNRDFGVWCVDRCVEEGRKATMRWLIESIGVTLSRRTGEPVPTQPHDNGKSVTIAQVGGRMYDMTTKRQDACTLAKIWQACTQASLHPTADTNHTPLRKHDVASALRIVIDHLETALYKPNGLDLRKIVRDQEDLAIARALRGQPTNVAGLAVS
jgi:hypothetical protein